MPICALFSILLKVQCSNEDLSLNFFYFFKGKATVQEQGVWGHVESVRIEKSHRLPLEVCMPQFA